MGSSAVGVGSRHLGLALWKQEPRELAVPAAPSNHEVPGWQPVIHRKEAACGSDEHSGKEIKKTTSL